MRVRFKKEWFNDQEIWQDQECWFSGSGCQMSRDEARDKFEVSVHIAEEA